jgi:hypothetical protein
VATNQMFFFFFFFFFFLNWKIDRIFGVLCFTVKLENKTCEKKGIREKVREKIRVRRTSE